MKEGLNAVAKWWIRHKTGIDPDQVRTVDEARSRMADYSRRQRRKQLWGITVALIAAFIILLILTILAILSLPDGT